MLPPNKIKDEILPIIIDQAHLVIKSLYMVNRSPDEIKKEITGKVSSVYRFFIWLALSSLSFTQIISLKCVFHHKSHKYYK